MYSVIRETDPVFRYASYGLPAVGAALAAKHARGAKEAYKYCNNIRVFCVFCG